MESQFGYGVYSGSILQAVLRRDVRDDGKTFATSMELRSPEKRLRRSRFRVAPSALNRFPSCSATGRKPNDGLEIAMFLNDHMADVVSEFPLRLLAGNSADAGHVLAIGELERCKTIGLAGIQIEQSNQKNLGEAAIQRIFAACEELGMASRSSVGNDGRADMQNMAAMAGWMPAEVSRSSAR